MVDRGDGKKSDTYGLPDSRHHVNQGLKQQQHAGEDRLVVAPTDTKAANEPQIFPYPPKEKWWAVGITESDTYGPPGLRRESGTTISTSTI